MKKKDKNLKWFTGGEFCGRVSVFFTEALIISSLIGTACMFIWDVNERRARKKFNK